MHLILTLMKENLKLLKKLDEMRRERAAEVTQEKKKGQNEKGQKGIINRAKRLKMNFGYSKEK